MKKSTFLNTITCIGFSLLTMGLGAQNVSVRLKDAIKPQATAASANKQLHIDPNAPATIPAAQKSAALTNCTDRIEFSGSTIGPYASIGSNSNTSSQYEIGVFQVFPNYTGDVIGVEFVGEKFNTAGNPKVYIAVFDLLGSQPDVNSQNPPSAPFITLFNTTSATQTFTFASPIPVTNGFAIGLFCLGSDSAKIHTGPTNNSAPYYSWLFTSFGSTTSFYSYYGVDGDLLIKPVIKTSVNPTWLTAKTSTGCALPAVYNFTNTSGALPSWIGNSVINPSGVTRKLNYGDASPIVNSFNGVQTHSYTTFGNYVASYEETYVGWVNNCVESQTLAVSVDNPQPAFTFVVNGLTVNFTNTSQNMTNFSWNFGDLSTSTQVNPSHTFATPGTYIVELEGTAPCGTVKYTQAVIVANTGIRENGLSSLISVFPNPAGATLQIGNLAETGVGTNVEVYNSIGVLVKSTTVDNHSGKAASLNISDLPEGYYFLKLKHEKGDIVKSFIKN